MKIVPFGKVAVIGSAIAIFGFALFVLFVSDRSQPVQSGESSGSDVRLHARGERSHSAQRTTHGSDRVSPGRSARSKSLQEFKGRWLALKSQSDNRKETEQQLVKECTIALLLYPEMLDLCAFVKENEIDAEGLWLALRNIGKSNLAPSARRSLIVSAALDKGDRNDLGVSLLRSLCEALGRDCPDEDIQGFLSALEQASVWSAQHAFLGYSKRLANTRPLEALQSTLAQMSKGVEPDVAVMGIKYLFSDTSTENWDSSAFREVESAINSATENMDAHVPEAEQSLEFLRSDLFGKWAARDPESAAAAALMYPEPVSSKLLLGVGSEFGSAASDRDVLKRLIDSLPAGPSRDAVLEGVLCNPQLLGLGFAKHIARQISDPDLKNDMFRSIEFFESAKLEGRVLEGGIAE